MNGGRWGWARASSLSLALWLPRQKKNTTASSFWHKQTALSSLWCKVAVKNSPSQHLPWWWWWRTCAPSSLPISPGLTLRDLNVIYASTSETGKAKTQVGEKSTTSKSALAPLIHWDKPMNSYRSRDFDFANSFHQKKVGCTDTKNYKWPEGWHDGWNSGEFTTAQSKNSHLLPWFVIWELVLETQKTLQIAITIQPGGETESSWAEQSCVQQWWWGRYHVMVTTREERIQFLEG